MKTTPFVAVLALLVAGTAPMTAASIDKGALTGHINTELLKECEPGECPLDRAVEFVSNPCGHIEMEECDDPLNCEGDCIPYPLDCWPPMACVPIEICDSSGECLPPNPFQGVPETGFGILDSALCGFNLGSDCGPLDPATATVTPTIGSTTNAAACTGTTDPLVQGTATSTIGGGAIIPASISATSTVTSLISWNFACDYGQFAQAFGSGGTFREVHVQAWMSGAWSDVGEPCAYTGTLNDISCTAPHRTGGAVVLKDTFSGKGIAGPGGAGIPPVELPTEVEICPNQSVTSARALNRGSISTIVPQATDVDNWACQRFGIHYLS